MKRVIVALFVVLSATFIVYGMADAKVTGECANCHTMHNSQDGQPVAFDNASWDGGAMTGDESEDPNGYLLVTGCIGCHSATSDKIVSVGSTTIPIVRTLTDPGGSYLAGGNFYYSDNDDNKGHNVTNPDDVLNYGPGQPYGTSGLDPAYGGHCAGSCHNTLFQPIRSGIIQEGCQGCHLVTLHHGEPGPYNATSHSTDPTYRFLTGHQNSPLFKPYVVGIEDDDWEADSSGHNWYKGWDQSAALNSDDAWEETREEHTISSFCSGCHNDFHAQEGTGSGGPWLRHPADQAMPTTGEFAGYTYSMETPVAYSTLPSTPAGGDEAGPVVACISCHRAHASEYADMLRFDYTTMLAGMGGSGGCFNCHADKN